MTPQSGVSSLVQRGLRVANEKPSIVYPSKVSAGNIRQLVKDLAEALCDTERERRRLAIELFRRVHPGQPLPESLV